MIFKDNGRNSPVIKLRALAIKVENDGELWIGSRSCRYQGNADIVLYGNSNDMESDRPGRKWLWGAPGGVIELHGQEKKSWTYLSDHLVRNGVAADNLLWEQNQSKDTVMGNRLVFHALR